MPYQIGQGYDVHRLTPNRPLVLGGVTIPYNLGLEGHSDADVLTHAVIDALCGAAALGDIGTIFPDTNPEFKGISSITLLERVSQMLKNYKIQNVDATIIAQSPKLSQYKQEMSKNIAKALNIEEAKVNIKATTEEGLGFTGKGEGIAAQAICLIDLS